ncbi:MAG: hypothetical protein EXS46_01800 [Candidatus Taylorbacteria bacterium]|nr:hypothetical protein [Candidatus Taylorbacteria bacterium]
MITKMATVDLTSWMVGIIALVVVGMVLVHKLKIKFPKLKVGWLSNGWKMIAVFIIEAFILANIYHFYPREWEKLQTTHGGFFWLWVIAGLAIFCLFFGQPTKEAKQTASGEDDHSHSTEPKGGLSTTGILFRIVVIVLLLLTASMLSSKFTTIEDRINQVNLGGGVASGGRPLHYYTAPLGSEVAIPIPESWKFEIRAISPDQRYWARVDGRNTDSRRLMWHGKPQSNEDDRYFEFAGSKIIWIEAETVPVVVEVIRR